MKCKRVKFTHLNKMYYSVSIKGIKYMIKIVC